MNAPACRASILVPSILALLAPGPSACAAPGGSAPVNVEVAATSIHDLIASYGADRATLRHYHTVASSPARDEAFRALESRWNASLDALDFDALDLEARIDWILLHNEIAKDSAERERRRRAREDVMPLIPYAGVITALVEARQAVEPLDPARTAETLDALARTVDAARREAETKKDSISRFVGNRAASAVDDLRSALDEMNGFYAGYDPSYDWWCKKPFEAARAALDEHAKFLREKLAGIAPGDETTILGDPIGRDALVAALASEMIPYTPEELLAIGEREMAWCEREMKRAAQDLGCGDDWKKALEIVKRQHVEPGHQTALVRELAREATEFLEKRELVTVPDLAKSTWRMEMMSPEAQLRNPFFLGGEEIIVAYPTDGMAHSAKQMSMRGNNRHFARATVHHELIPGHRLQGFMTDRYNVQRQMFSTPFWTEGWALYWEMFLWDLEFAQSAENRVGMLFWRMHRCARIKFSLAFHLGRMTADQCIDLLVDTVGHERDNASAEVRRSFAGGYGPLYQCAYMIGGLQIRALHRDLVDSGRMTNRAFHDAILHGGNMPIEMVRARLTNAKLARDFVPAWRFYEL